MSMIDAMCEIDGVRYPCKIDKHGEVHLSPEALAALPPHMRADGWFVEPPMPTTIEVTMRVSNE